MAIVLSTAESSIREPKRKNRWILKFDYIPGEGTNNSSEALAIDVFTASRPSITFSATEINRLNEKFYFAGKPEWDQINLSFYDMDKGKDSAGQILYRWATMIYNPLTGGQGYAVNYKTNATLVMLGPDGSVIEVWDLFGCFPENVNFNDLSYDGSEYVQVDISLRFDYAILQEDTTSGGIPTTT